jgi:hypothetical protein
LELLCLSVLIPFLKGNITGTDAFCNSLHWKFWSQVEWFESNEVMIIISLTLLDVWLISHFISIIDIPKLVWSSSSELFSGNWLSFFVSSIFKSKNSTVTNIFKFTTSFVSVFACNLYEFPDLPPSWVGCVVLDFVTLTGTLDINWIIGGSRFDSSCSSVEVPFLANFSVLSLKD